MKLGTAVGLGPGHIVFDGDPAPQQNGHSPPNFRPMSIVAKGWMHQDTTWQGGIAYLGPGDIVLDEDPASPRGYRVPQFSAHVCCGQRLDGSRCPGREVDLGLGDIVLDGVQAAPKGVQPPIFGPCLLWPNGSVNQDATWYGWTHVDMLDRDPSPCPKGAQQPPSFRPMSIVAKRSPISATAEHLFSINVVLGLPV